jgi:hypothetical protein
VQSWVCDLAIFGFGANGKWSLLPAAIARA